MFFVRFGVTYFYLNKFYLILENLVKYSIDDLKNTLVKYH